jgi:hypothetical protein
MDIEPNQPLDKPIRGRPRFADRHAVQDSVIFVRVNAELLAKIDAKRGKQSRAAYLRTAGQQRLLFHSPQTGGDQ